MDIVVSRAGDGYAADWGAGARRCAVGRAGIAEKQREGDGVTPLGRWPLRQVLFRADRISAPRTTLQLDPIEPDQAWCDVPGDPNYNRMVRLPYPSIDERLWRDDSLYDLIVVVGYNDSPPISGKGSAIFLHLARPDFSPTAGCVATARGDLYEAVEQLRPGDCLIVRE